MTDLPPSEPQKPEGKLLSLDGKYGLAALGVSVVALIVAVLPYAADGGFDGKVRAYLLKHPEVLVETSSALRAKQERPQIDAVKARVAAAPHLLAVDPRDPAFGPADAKVTLVEYFDFQCPGCKATAPAMLSLMANHPDVRFVFKDYPILDRGDPAGSSHYAARASQAAHQQGRYLPVFRAIMAEGDLSPEKVDQILQVNGVDLTRARAEMGSTATLQHLANTQTSAAALQLYATPTFFINGRFVEFPGGALNPAILEQQIQAAKRR